MFYVPCVTIFTKKDRCPRTHFIFLVQLGIMGRQCNRYKQGNGGGITIFVMKNPNMMKQWNVKGHIYLEDKIP